MAHCEKCRNRVLAQYLIQYQTLYPDSFVLQMYDLCDSTYIRVVV